MARSTVAAPNALLLVMGQPGRKIPESMGGAGIASTDSCIAIGCKADVDGETKVVLGPAQEVDPGSAPAFRGRLATPGGKVLVRTVLGTCVLEMSLRRRGPGWPVA
jgi:hypothetical protein